MCFSIKHLFFYYYIGNWYCLFIFVNLMYVMITLRFYSQSFVKFQMSEEDQISAVFNEEMNVNFSMTLGLLFGHGLVCMCLVPIRSIYR